ncbi:MAG: hypothetical protein U0Q18_28875 [Bryobacteraceae bacterium]
MAFAQTEVPQLSGEACAAAQAVQPSRRHWIPYAAVSVLILVPCFWQQRIQAGDLSSHIYNAWLAQLVERGQAAGVTLARQSSNVLFDLMLSALFNAFGPRPAERIAVAAAVLIFFWGAFGFVWNWSRKNSRSAPWFLAPCLAMLSYGWVFHMGLFNFYLSLGLCLAALAIASRPSRIRLAGAVGVLAVAYTAHGLPVGWAIAALAYRWIAPAISPRYRTWLPAVGAAGLAGVAIMLRLRYQGSWTPGQITAVSGADQVWVFGVHYCPIAVAVLALWMVWLLRALEARGAERVLVGSQFQFCLLTALSVVLMPGMIRLPGMHGTINILTERMSLATGVMLCALVAGVRPRRGEMAILAVVTTVFFGCVFADERAFNGFETELERVVAQIPPGQRVISTVGDPNSRVNSLAHSIDRVCIGRCFSYANYEPSTAQFRVRANQENPVVIWDYPQSWALQAGQYRVQKRDLPLYDVLVCGPSSKTLCVSTLQAGTQTGLTWLAVAPVFGPWDRRGDSQ